MGLTVAVALGAVAIATPAAAGPPPAAAAGRSLRVLAYNTGFLWVDLPGLCGSIDINDGKYDDGASYPERASDIADAILATDNDIVILEEVFSDPVKDILVSKLQSEYPTYIKRSPRRKPSRSPIPSSSVCSEHRERPARMCSASATRRRSPRPTAV